jgi:cell division protease FtsH
LKQSHKTLALWAVMLLVFFSVLHRVYTPKVNDVQIKFNEFIREVETNHISEVTFVSGKNEIFGKYRPNYKNGSSFKTTGNTGDEIFKLCKANGIVPNYVTNEPPFWQPLLLQLGPAVLLIALMVFFLRQLQVGGGKAMSFGKSKAKLMKTNSV